MREETPEPSALSNAALSRYKCPVNLYRRRFSFLKMDNRAETEADRTHAIGAAKPSDPSIHA
ncbi:MAG: hypothetical protein BWX48_02822 [Verrucomicrobia bacterium ADurb.Bin006]|nr:MAG: hypothetical protein BWX48_02822 [Verrucomicrobia bacterium ADurb.Bin006]